MPDASVLVEAPVPELPTTVWLHIFSFLHVPALQAAARVCQEWSRMVATEGLWEAVAQATYPPRTLVPAAYRGSYRRLVLHRNSRNAVAFIPLCRGAAAGTASGETAPAPAPTGGGGAAAAGGRGGGGAAAADGFSMAAAAAAAADGDGVIRSAWRYNHPAGDRYYECRLLSMEMQPRPTHTSPPYLRLYFDVRGEVDLRDPSKSSLSVVRLNRRRDVQAAAAARRARHAAMAAAGLGDAPGGGGGVGVGWGWRGHAEVDSEVEDDDDSRFGYGQDKALLALIRSRRAQAVQLADTVAAQLRSQAAAAAAAASGGPPRDGEPPPPPAAGAVLLLPGERELLHLARRVSRAVVLREVEEGNDLDPDHLAALERATLRRVLRAWSSARSGEEAAAAAAALLTAAGAGAAAADGGHCGDCGGDGEEGGGGDDWPAAPFCVPMGPQPLRLLAAAHAAEPPSSVGFMARSYRQHKGVLEWTGEPLGRLLRALQEHGGALMFSYACNISSRQTSFRADYSPAVLLGPRLRPGALAEQWRDVAEFREPGEEFVRLQAEGDEQERARWRPGLPAGVLARGVAWWGPPRRHGGAAGVGAGAEGEEDEDEEGVGAGVLWRGANAR